MNRKRNFITLFLVLVVLLTVIPFANAAAATATQIISAGSWGSLFWRQITTNVTAYVNPVYDSQALHTKGYITTIGVNSTKTNSCSASTSLTAGVDAAFVQLSTTLEVGTSVSYSTGTSITYTITADTASGWYRIEHVFPRVQVKQQKVRLDYSGETIEWQRTISYAPKLNDAYRRLTRYANP